MKIVILILLISILSACQKVSDNQQYYSYYREDGMLKEEFYGEGENSDIPRVFEAVSVDENGRDNGKGGDTHFHFLDEEVSIGYQIYDSPETALKQLKMSVEKAHNIIRKGIIKNEAGEEVGQKVLLIEKSEFKENEYHRLIWTRNSRFTKLSGRSLKVIEAYEKDRKL